MRKDLFLAFLGFWVAIVPFLPIHRGSTQTALLVFLGLGIAVLALVSVRRSSDESQ